MAAPSDQDRSPEPERQARRLLTRAEAAVLAGMMLCILSLFFAWPLPGAIGAAGKLAGPAMVMDMTRSAAGIPEVRWPVMVGAILSGLLLAFSPAPGSGAVRVMPLAFVQALCGLVCLILALMHFGMLPGPLVELLGGALLTFGAVDRLGQFGAGPST